MLFIYPLHPIHLRYYNHLPTKINLTESRLGHTPPLKPTYTIPVDPVLNLPAQPLRRGDELGPPGDLLRAGALLTGDTMPPPHPAFNTFYLPQLFEIRIADLIPKFYHAPQSNKPSRLLLSPRRTDTLIYHKNSLHPFI